MVFGRTPEDSLLEYLTDEQIAELKAKVGEEQFNITFGCHEECEDEHYNTSHLTAKEARNVSDDVLL